MINQTYVIVTQKQIEDFKKICKEKNINHDEFEIEELKIDRNENTAEVKVRRNSVFKIYHADTKSKWPDEFNNDLGKGVFKD